jgi:protein involved in polysaccharide export with SLBB domain
VTPAATQPAFGLDAWRPVHLHQTGNGRWQVRPVVFVTIHPQRAKLVRVFGEARNPGSMAFELCPIYPVSAIGGGSPNTSPECLDVFTDADTVQTYVAPGP